MHRKPVDRPTESSAINVMSSDAMENTYSNVVSMFLLPPMNCYCADLLLKV